MCYRTRENVKKQSGANIVGHPVWAEAGGEETGEYSSCSQSEMFTAAQQRQSSNFLCEAAGGGVEEESRDCTKLITHHWAITTERGLDPWWSTSTDLPSFVLYPSDIDKIELLKLVFKLSTFYISTALQYQSPSMSILLPYCKHIQLTKVASLAFFLFSSIKSF